MGGPQDQVVPMSRLGMDSLAESNRHYRPRRTGDHEVGQPCLGNLHVCLSVAYSINAHLSGGPLFLCGLVNAPIRQLGIRSRTLQLTSLVNHSTIGARCIRIYTSITSHPICQRPFLGSYCETHFLRRQAIAVVSSEVIPYQLGSPSQLSDSLALRPSSLIWAYESALSS